MSVYAPTRVVRRWFDGYRQAAADLGYVPDPQKIALSIPIVVADTDTSAHGQAQPAIEWLFYKGLKQPMELVNPPGYMSEASMRGLLMTERKPFNQLSYADLLAEGYAVVGSPVTVASRLREMYDELGGFGQLIGLFAVGTSSHEQTIRSTELFAAEVIPALRPLGVSADAMPAPTAPPPA
jgi:alkanesulfonate monooxygenase SsuD/methylene tetrahydromethanopterin reductase-like flavin-dependent oxidoreductase (luciferase family)